MWRDMFPMLHAGTSGTGWGIARYNSAGGDNTADRVEGPTNDTTGSENVGKGSGALYRYQRLCEREFPAGQSVGIQLFGGDWSGYAAAGRQDVAPPRQMPALPGREPQLGLAIRLIEI